ncbi:hypothetical protein D5018_16465 [Parashewanella curva]|uniref:Phage abortive infection protein n=1 Tax=Parashewanella curva TaxID=2338552 RepID=A0A3L8PVK9_9GAMM|nr:hypothetical protein [Parashewanella curva]RLV58613.1 hypothetical protein D5018_16465 [Parashewanella curva]
MKNSILNIVLIALVAFLLVFGIYAVNFPNGLSDQNVDWGNFGSFFGGVLSPLLSFISIIYVVKATQAQIKAASDSTREQINTANKNLRLELIEIKKENLKSDILKMLEKAVDNALKAKSTNKMLVALQSVYFEDIEFPAQEGIDFYVLRYKKNKIEALIPTKLDVVQMISTYTSLVQNIYEYRNEAITEQEANKIAYQHLYIEDKGFISKDLSEFTRQSNEITLLLFDLIGNGYSFARAQYYARAIYPHIEKLSKFSIFDKFALGNLSLIYTAPTETNLDFIGAYKDLLVRELNFSLKVSLESEDMSIIQQQDIIETHTGSIRWYQVLKNTKSNTSYIRTPDGIWGEAG